jgi:alpha-tubulin suppressor-like RCC1 family protein
VSFLIAEKGKAIAFGDNAYGQLGIGNKENSSIPVVVKALEGMNIIQICCGDFHSMALTGNGKNG